MLQRYRKALLYLTLAVVVGLAVFAPAPEGPAVRAPDAARNVKGVDNQARIVAKDGGSRSVVSEIPARSTLEKGAVDLFESQSWQPPLPKAAKVAPASPQPPAMTFRFAGRLVQDGKVQLFVSKGDTPIAVKIGDVLDGYVVESITATEIALVYPPSGYKASVVIPAGAPADAAPLPVPLTRTVPAPIPTQSVIGVPTPASILPPPTPAAP